MASETRTILIKVDASGAGPLDAMSRKLESLNKSVGNLSDGMSFLTRTFKTLATAFVVNEIRVFIRDIFQTGVELKNMSQAVGVSVEDLAKIKVAAELSGVPMENLTVALRRLNANAVAAATGNNIMAASFKTFGVNVVDSNGHVKNATDILLKLADRFKNLEDGPVKSALAIKLFGRSGTDIIPMLNLGSEAILKFSLHINTEFATSAKELVNNLQVMKLEFRNLIFDGIAPGLPVLNAAIEKFDSFGNTNVKVSKNIKFVESLVAILAISFKTISEVIGFAGDSISILFNGSIITAVGLIKTFINGIAELAERANALSFGDFETAFSPQSKTVDSFTNMLDTLDQKGKDFSLKMKVRLYDTLTYSKNLEDLIAYEHKKDKTKTTKSTVDPGEINKRIAHEQELLDVLRAQGKEQAALQDLELRKYGLSTAAYENEKDRYKTQQDIVKATKDFNLFNPKESSLARQYREEAELQEKSRENSRLALEDQKHGLEGFKVGATEAFHTYIDAARDTAAQTKTLFTDAFKGMEDGIVKFVETGKLNFADFANSVIDDIIRIQVRMLLAGLISSVADAFAPTDTTVSGGGQAGGWAPNLAANGGIMTDQGMVPLQKYSSGGIARRPQAAIFGEGSTPEAYIPLPDSRTVPVTLTGEQGNNYVTVQINMDSSQESIQASGQKANALGKIISAAVVKELVNQRRNGGMILAGSG